MSENGGEFKRGFIFAAGATLGVIATLGIVGAIQSQWMAPAPAPATGTTVVGRSYRVSPINPNLNYSTIKGLRTIGYSRVGVRTL